MSKRISKLVAAPVRGACSTGGVGKISRVTCTGIVAVAAALSVGPALAQDPLGGLFTYQGQLKDAGVPVEGETDMRFALFDEDAGGNQIGATVIYDGQGGNFGPVAVATGVFTVWLDFSETAFDGNERWLEIEVRYPHDPTDTAPYTLLTPRPLVTATPYSLATRGLAVDAAGNVGIGTPTPTETLEVAGPIHSTTGGFKFPDGTIQDTAAGPGVWTQGGDDIFYAAGSVGIGTMGPLVGGGDVCSVMPETLPTGRYYGAAAYDPVTGRIYYFGGSDGSAPLSQIVAYDPIAGSVRLMTATLPTACAGLACAHDPGTSRIYCFGGYVWGSGTRLDQILAYDPSADTITLMSATLPTPRTDMACAYDPATDRIYCFGGQDAAGVELDGILAYNTTSNMVTVMSATLPTGRHGLGSAYYPGTQRVYCFGGYDGSVLDEIIAYDPSGDTVLVMAATLPTPIHHMACAYDANSARILCLGGSGIGSRREISAYDPTSDMLAVMSATLPSAPGGLPGAYDPGTGRIYCFGGAPGGPLLDEIVAYTSPRESRLQVGDPGDGTGAIANTWSIFSSREYKRDITPLLDADYKGILTQLVSTDLFRYRYAADPLRRLHLGVIAEQAPAEMLAPGGKAVSLADQTAFLMAAIKAQQAVIDAKAQRISELETRLERLESLLGTASATPVGGGQ